MNGTCSGQQKVKQMGEGLSTPNRQSRALAPQLECVCDPVEFTRSAGRNLASEPDRELQIQRTTFMGVGACQRVAMHGAAMRWTGLLAIADRPCDKMAEAPRLLS